MSAEIPEASEPSETPQIIEDTAPTELEKPAGKRIPLRWLLGGIGFILVIIALAAWLGYNTGIQDRLKAQASQVTMDATTQFQLALQDQAAGRLETAKERLQYVIQLDPEFPGAAKKLAEVALSASITATPTPVPATPTATIAPTPDLRGVEELFNQARQDLADKKWDEAITTLDQLRTDNLTYRAVDVDGMYYVALRYRGAQKILQLGKLQEGLYDLALAERFGPLDGEALGYRSWATLYLTGASFWKVDWKQALYYFGQVYPYFPNLRDSTGLTASERYRQAAIGYADQLLAAKSFCDADKYYQEAFKLGKDAKAEQNAKDAAQKCAESKAPPPPNPADFTATPSPTVGSTNPPAAPSATPAQSTAAPPTAAPPTAAPPTTAPPTPVPPTATSAPPTSAPATAAPTAS
ncbi:MAG: hypothetical protein M1281_07790 [Chloroflexi bacterium]|nr:hypothetical protein [Chloroflexota bacterium]